MELFSPITDGGHSSSVRIPPFYHESDEDSNSSNWFWRYQWRDDVRDEVLGRLIDFNAQRKREENRTESSKIPALTPPPQVEMPRERPSFLVRPPLFAGRDD